VKGPEKSSYRGNDLDSPHVRSKHGWDYHATIFLLPVFQDGDQSAADCESGTIESVKKTDFLLPAGTIANIGTPRLEIFEIAAGGDFPKGLLTREPNLDIICFRRGKAQISGA
jgi:hypothetical protein